MTTNSYKRGKKGEKKTIKYFIEITSFVNQFHNQTKSTNSGNCFSLDNNIERLMDISQLADILWLQNQ